MRYTSRAWIASRPWGSRRPRASSTAILLKQDYSSADLLTVYLLPVATEMVTPILEKQLKKGARIVAHDFQFAAWKPEQTVDIDNDGEGRAHELYLYRR